MKVSKKEADRYLTAFLDAIMHNLKKEGRVVVQGFGSFRLNKHKARVAKKPITGETIYLPVRLKPVFHPGKELRERINGVTPGSSTPAGSRAKERTIESPQERPYPNVHGA
ncbi:MAG: HU family DNA-binding protein [Nitrospinaceae bacterium]|nr:HU family DNA-binding protein [Nitrospinaceae bacterium]NIR57649.1 HU family DNA-binding protein [Nitrospinaceae bacterium]NIS88124.1 HU family DNA-binding protein [Nitrospinaceae bacterium]NIT84991.1 HU family DNA-binding protein [Nitrospinaceae bacterium]NIW61909.1 hypothetical protein [Nitrospinaceae bacterium]